MRDNPDVVESGRSWRHLLAADFWGTPATNVMSNKSWRPLTIAFYRAVRVASTSGGVPLSPRPYHAANVVLHAAVTWQVSSLAWRLAAWEGHGRPGRAALLAGLLFAVHPVHCEAVAGLVGAAELLCALFVLLGLRCYLAAATGRSLLLLPFSLLLVLAASLAKETGFTALGSYACVDLVLLLRCGGAPRLPALLARMAALALTGAAYLAVRYRVTGGQAVEVTTWRIADNHLSFLPLPSARPLTVAHSHWRYARLLLSPYTLCADWNYACIAPVVDAADPRNAGALLLYTSYALLLLLAQPWRGLPRLLSPARAPSPEEDSRSRPARLRLFLATALALAPFLPASNALVWVGAYLAERLLYLPSVGFCLWLGAALAGGASAHSSRLRLALASLLLLSYAHRLHVRVPQWHSDATLFTADAATCPAGARLRFNAGLQARLAGNCSLAAEHQRASLAVLASNNCGPHYELGTCAYDSGRAGEAADAFEASLGCVDTAKNAAEAVRKVLSELHAAFPASPAVLLAYGRVIQRVDPTLGAEQACVAAGRAAELLRGSEGAGRAAEALSSCPLGARAARARANASLFGLEGSRLCDAGAADALRRFGEAQGAGGRGGVVAAASQVATDFVRVWGVACRSHGAYLKAVNALQRADSYNPLLHWEWARLLRWGSLSGETEARQHAQFASTMFLALAQQQRQERPGAEGEAEAAALAAQSAAVLREVEGWAGQPAGPPSVTQLVDAPLSISQLRALGGLRLDGGARAGSRRGKEEL